MSAVLWKYLLKIRSKNSSGTVQHTFYPDLPPVQVGPPLYDMVRDEIELLDFTQVHRYRGFRARLPLVFEQVAAEVKGTPDDLGVVLADIYTLGNYLEACLDDNLLTAPQDTSNAAWTVSAATKDTDATAVTDPFGVATTEAKVRVTGTDLNPYIRQSVTPLTVKAGQIYTLSVYAKSPTGAVTANLRILDQAGVIIATTSISLTTSWTRFSVTGVCPAGTTGVKVEIHGWNYITSADVDSCAWQLHEGDALLPYVSTGNWKTVVLGSEDYGPQPPDLRRTAVRQELELRASALQSTIPAPDSGAW